MNSRTGGTEQEAADNCREAMKVDPRRCIPVARKATILRQRT